MKPESAPTTLKTLPFYKVMLTCYLTRQSGLLVLQHESHKKMLLLEKGQPRGCRSNIKQETLGHILVEQGILKEEQLRQALKECTENDGMALGAFLVSRGQLEPNRLIQMLEDQLKNRLFDLFTWEDGTVTLHAKSEKITPEPIQLSTKTPTLIYLGLVHAAEKKGTYKKLADGLVVSSIAASALKFDDFELAPGESAFLRAIQGERTVGSTVAAAKLKPENSRLLLYVFEQLGLLTLITPSVASASANSATPAQAAHVSAASDFGRTVSDRLKQIQGKNFFEVLGVDEKVDEATIRKIYFKLAKDYHPDKLRTLADQKARQDGEVLFARISEAYNTLIDPNKRQEYVVALSFGGKDDATERATQILESEMIFQKGRVLMRQGEIRKSKELFDQAIKLHPDEPEYNINLGYCQFKIGIAEKNSSLVQAGKKLIEKHKDDRKHLEDGYYYLGEIALLENNRDQAYKMFERALEINPKSHEASRQIRLLDMRASKKK